MFYIGKPLLFFLVIHFAILIDFYYQGKNKITYGGWGSHYDNMLYHYIKAKWLYKFPGTFLSTSLVLSHGVLSDVQIVSDNRLVKHLNPGTEFSSSDMTG